MTHIYQSRDDLAPPCSRRGMQRRSLRANEPGVRSRVEEDTRHLDGRRRSAFVCRGGHEGRLAGPDKAVGVRAAGQDMPKLCNRHTQKTRARSSSYVPGQEGRGNQERKAKNEIFTTAPSKSRRDYYLRTNRNSTQKQTKARSTFLSELITRRGGCSFLQTQRKTPPLGTQAGEYIQYGPLNATREKKNDSGNSSPWWRCRTG